MKILFSNNKEKISEAYRQFMKLKPGMMCIENSLTNNNSDNSPLRYCENIFISDENKYMNIDYIVRCDLGGKDTYPNVLLDWGTPSHIIIQTNIATPTNIIKFVEEATVFIEEQKYYVPFDFSYIYFVAKQSYWRNHIHITKYPNLQEKTFDYFDHATERLKDHLVKTQQNIENIKVASYGLHKSLGSESPINMIDGFMMEKIKDYSILIQGIRKISLTQSTKTVSVKASSVRKFILSNHFPFLSILFCCSKYFLCVFIPSIT